MSAMNAQGLGGEGWQYYTLRHQRPVPSWSSARFSIRPLTTGSPRTPRQGCSGLAWIRASTWWRGRCRARATRAAW
ncbi:hypothetical protein G6F55_014323 [Rhizopus delemar]|nr:hypothetical protein G6F55_014323 [Rhizopus delemar]